MFTHDPDFSKNFITGDESMVHSYDIEPKEQPSSWKRLEEPRSKRSRQVRSNVKVLLTVFFDGMA